MNLKGGIWHNEFCFDLRDTGRKVPGFPSWRKRTLYEYLANPDTPMTFQFGERCFIRPDNHGFTEMASVPEILQWLFMPKDLHNPSAILHDSACREKGLYFSSTADGIYTFCSISSAAAAKLLGRGIYAAGYTKRASFAWRAVSLFGPRWETERSQL